MMSWRPARVSKTAWWSCQSLVMVLAAIVLLSLYAYAWGTGPSVTPDSFYYLAAARSWTASKQLLAPSGAPYVYWGPLYPLLLSGFGAARQPAWAVAWLHGLGLLGSWLGWNWLGTRLLKARQLWPQVYPWMLALSTPWLVASKFVWAETGFTLLFTAYAVALYCYLTSRRVGWLLAATLAAGLLPLQRTTGLFLLAGVLLGLALSYGRSLRGGGGWLLLHFVLSVAGGILWQLYVWRTGLDDPLSWYAGAAWGLQPFSDFSFVLLRWVLPLLSPTAAVSWGYGVGGLMLVGILLVGATELGPFGRLLLITAVTYIGWHVLSNVLGRGAAGVHNGERYMAVLFGPVMLLLLGAIQRLRSYSPPILLLLTGLWLLYPAIRILHNAHYLHNRLPATYWLPRPLTGTKQ